MNKLSEPTSTNNSSLTPTTFVNAVPPIPVNSTATTSHKVSAIYPSLVEAKGVCTQLIENGFAKDDIEVLQEHSTSPTGEGTSAGTSDEVLKEVLVDGAIGTAVGVGIGALSTIVLVAASVTLFVASPLIAPLALMGNLATIGGGVGGAIGAGRKEAKFSDVVAAAIKAGNSILLVHTHNDSQTELAKKIIADSLKGRDEVVMESN